MHASDSEGFIENDLHLLSLSNREAMKSCTTQSDDLLHLLSETAPVTHAVAGCFPTAVSPARVVEPPAMIGNACVEMEKKTRNKKRADADESSAQQKQKQKVL